MSEQVIPANIAAAFDDLRAAGLAGARAVADHAGVQPQAAAMIRALADEGWKVDLYALCRALRTLDAGGYDRRSHAARIVAEALGSHVEHTGHVRLQAEQAGRSRYDVAECWDDWAEPRQGLEVMARHAALARGVVQQLAAQPVAA